MNLAIITARGGSKRIPHKNIKEFLGRPMIDYAISAAKNSGLFDEVMVSTDDEQIAAISRQLGASVPFMRSAAASDDYATTADVLREVLAEYSRRGAQISRFACIYPCVPLLTGELLKEAWSAWEASPHARLTPVVRYGFAIQRSMVVRDGVLAYREPQFARTRSQDLEPCYHDAGAFYFYRTDAGDRRIDTGDHRTDSGDYLAAINSTDTMPFELNELQTQDIDTLDDWKLAEFKAAYLGGKLSK